MCVVKELYVIVHELSVGTDCSHPFLNQRNRALEVFETLKKLKKSSEFLEIKEDANELHNKMPPPSDDLKVLVCGAYRKDCCDKQYQELKSKGHSVEFHEEACLSYDVEKD